jgi:hypothetical protein
MEGMTPFPLSMSNCGDYSHMRYRRFLRRTMLTPYTKSFAVPELQFCKDLLVDHDVDRFELQLNLEQIGLLDIVGLLWYRFSTSWYKA